jgi:hypothetical protein
MDTEESIQHTKSMLGDFLKKTWESKVMHGEYIRRMGRVLVSEESTLLLLPRGDLKGETEGEIIAAQDQALQSKRHAIKMLHSEIYSKRRLYKHCDETVECIISACPILAKQQYIKRHDKSVCLTTL